jgi:hypothetical protein
MKERSSLDQSSRPTSGRVLAATLVAVCVIPPKALITGVRMPWLAVTWVEIVASEAGVRPPATAQIQTLE